MADHINYPNLVGGAAILTFNQWASKVTQTKNDPRGHGTHTIKSIKGRKKRRYQLLELTFQSKKGSKAGDNNLYHQQTYLMERDAIKITIYEIQPHAPKNKQLWSLVNSWTPTGTRACHHIDANQTPNGSKNGINVKHASIEWLKKEHGVDDPFIDLHGNRPPSTTKILHRDIYYILTFGLNVRGVTTLEPDLCHLTLTILASAKMLISLSSLHKQDIHEAFTEHKLWEKTRELYDKVIRNDIPMGLALSILKLDDQLTEIIVAGENKCAKRFKGRQP